MSFERQESLGAFLRAMRARIGPDEAGLPHYPGRRRRVPGLRRAEVAELAGVSTDYYTRMEQGRAGEVSAEVLDALTRVLRLSPSEAEYLLTLARPPVRSIVTPEPTTALRTILDAVRAPAYATNRRLDIVAANLPLRLLISPPGGRPEAPHNFVTWTFLDPYSRRLVSDWETSAAVTTAALRLQTAAAAADSETRELIATLRARSDDFVRLWDSPQVPDVWRGQQVARHPWAGEYHIDFETMEFPGDDNLTMAVYAPVPGTGSELVIDRLLHHWRGPDAGRFWDLTGAAEAQAS
ncbi:helix-turn-helix transcriptional regulator [Catenuloplanes atrovinosus]|uniref:Transcriptional regulator with XRE-family HTH domain n=1 Tax=Catenuloplanes atrovinosus TaxID=137266 RepID=A0AAE4CAR2_9ACTN|nr:helix-turn-helix transcriptional regulator [Catenuloplanes atrovinosus]MDR7277318.1 transcriptional regulator with XRE-family HTH domain [Catenuloplanes atrovinosus]